MQKNIFKFLFLLIILGFISLFVKGYFYGKEIELNRVTTVCKYYKCKKFPKTTEASFRYYVNNQLFKNSYDRCPDNSDQKMNRFFVLYYSSKDPNKIIVDFDKEITDTIKIYEAGFSKKDLVNPLD